MVSSMKYALTLAIIAAVACTAFGLQCYVCDSSQDNKCGEKFDAQAIFKRDCLGISQHQSTLNFQQFLQRNATGCMKRLFKTQGGAHRIERTCFFGDVHNTQFGCSPDPVQLATQQQLMSCDVCTGNLCNGSGAMAPIGFAIAIFFVLARIFS